MIRDTDLAAVMNAIIPGVGQFNIAPRFSNTAGRAILGEPRKRNSLDMRDMQTRANSCNAPVGSGCCSRSSTVEDRDRTSPSFCGLISSASSCDYPSEIVEMAQGLAFE